ncbi:MAG: hypothetical protein ACYC96_15840 [Fimbriimonadaceae bacterium]
MQRWNVEAPGPDFCERLEAAAAELGLGLWRTTLRSLPPNVHWHLRSPGVAGTLEVTWLTEVDRAWLSTRANRQAEWVRPMAEALLKRWNPKPVSGKPSQA